MKIISWHSKLVLALLIFLPIYFMIAALGTKVGLWGWMTGLVGMTFTAGPPLLGIVGVVALISMIVGIVKKPRQKFTIAIGAIGVFVAAGMFAGFASVGGKAGANPIHDVATDTADPPTFSAATMQARTQGGANPLSDYQTPLGEIELFAGTAPELAIKSHAQIINDTYSALSPLPLGGASKADAVAAVAAAMGEMGMSDIRPDVAAGRVEGVAESFWYGFKDDAVARVGEAEIDFRSVSRVGRSDLGANAARITELRERVAAQIGQR
ncbi:DUF1499 domain-containing protein [Qipengyuania sp. ASV99]|uniref:DUF1499 domain-containing protein n=1 Tax=Qipengyuania sp. ASV99 TaxID=3399681 RepID=UPI003A4C7C5A